MTEREKELDKQLKEMSVKFIRLKSITHGLMLDLKQAEQTRLKLAKLIRGKNENNNTN